MKVLITGGGGFIGSHLAEQHLRRGDEVWALDTAMNLKVRHLLPEPGFHYVKASVLDAEAVEAFVLRCDLVYHMAAVVGMFHVLKHPVDVTRVNVIGCERVLEAAARSGRRPRIVLASSSSVYGGVDPESMHEEATIRMAPRSPLLNYALSKFANEVQGAAYAQEHGLPVVSVRLFNTVGPGQAGMYGFVVPRFVQQAIAGAAISIATVASTKRFMRAPLRLPRPRQRPSVRPG